MTRNVFINAGSAVEIDRHFDKGFKALALEAFRRLESSYGSVEPDTLVISSMAPESMSEQIGIAGVIADHLALRRLKVFRVEMGEASGLAAILTAYSLVSSGLSKGVLVIGVEKVSEYPVSLIAKVYSMIGDSDYTGLYGISPASEAAILAKIYMDRYGYSYEDLFKWPVLMHKNAVKNPHAQLRFMLKSDSYKDSPIISEPLRLLDAYPFGDGASALYISSMPGDTAVEISGVGSSNDSCDAISREDPLFFRSVRESFDDALRMAGIGRDRVKYIEIHDSYTPYAYIVLESLGLVERGDAPRKISMESSSIDTTYVNISGGLKARGHPWGATGIYQTYEVFRSLLGEAELSDSYGAVQSMNGPGSQSYSVIMRRVR
ncbi:MAG: hypothetical protein DJ555_03485 [Desulfurococcaceae archaeon]|jgi:acetyl-CoA acetyltransferase|nr:MAG: hypothetical protein DJ555_03485 [Desulfurococcaceae archaeon]